MTARAAEPAVGVRSDLDAARRVLDLEAAGLAALNRTLDENFVAAVECLGGVAGRIIVTGIGKSGHVARKIAATLASTGSPAFYIHSVEASHGDLGMVTGGDAVLALSNSGTTTELSDIVTYTRRFGNPLIAVTSVADSPLAEQADIALILPKAQEACPLGLAPTTSTTMMLALGDAISVALLERKGFSYNDFRVLHPGGKLGSTLLRVSDIMQSAENLPLCSSETEVAEALLVMTRSSDELRSFGCVGIVDDGKLIGVISDGDLRRHMEPGLLGRRADEVMTADPLTIRPQALAAEALGFMSARKITFLFVVEDGQPVGFVHMHDCLKAGVA